VYVRPHDSSPELLNVLFEIRNLSYEVISILILSDGSVVQRWATGWTIKGSSPGRGWEFFSSPPRPDRL
jgi:hypothetical protein